MNNVEMDVDYYEVLQISRNAEIETIHRVYRMMATRFHPDNPRTGNTETFLLLKRAYQVLSDPIRRAEYNETRQTQDQEPLPIFELKDFVSGLEGEMNRRLGALSLLYNRRRTNEDKPSLGLLDLEKLMGFPREHLNFTLWYLKAKGYVSLEDNADCGITATGIDFIEGHSSEALVKELIDARSGAGAKHKTQANRIEAHHMNETPIEVFGSAPLQLSQAV